MNYARALSLLGACGIIAFSAVVYLKYVTEDSTIRLVDDSVPSALVVTAASNSPMATPSEASVTKYLPTIAEKNSKKDAADEKIAELGAKLKRLNEKFDALNQELQRRLAAVSATDNEKLSEEALLEGPRTDPRVLVELQRQEQERVQTLENNFLNESTGDIQWSSQASTALENALASEPAGNAQVNSLECRSRQCRVELMFQDDISRNNLMNSLPRQLAEILPVIAIHQVEQREGTTTLVLYLFGEGYETPQNNG